MAERELGPAALRVAQAVGSALPDEDFVVGCSGGADSMALALGAAWAVRHSARQFVAVVVDHGLQPGSDDVASAIVARLRERGITAEALRVQVGGGGGIEAAAREARLGALASYGCPVLLGHTLDDQAETVLLGLARGSGLRSLAGMAPVRGPFVRPLLGVRRAETVQACREWGIEVWDDPHNTNARFTRVRVRERVLPVLEAELGPGVTEALARTAELARADVVHDQATDERPNARWLAGLEPAERARVIKAWLEARGASGVTLAHVRSVEALVSRWRGQKGVDVSGGRVVRRDGELCWMAHTSD